MYDDSYYYIYYVLYYIPSDKFDGCDGCEKNNFFLTLFVFNVFNTGVSGVGLFGCDINIVDLFCFGNGEVIKWLIILGESWSSSTKNFPTGELKIFGLEGTLL